MAMEEALVTRLTCDGCGAQRFTPDPKKETGYSGTVKYIAPSGYTKRAEWWAHTKRCIGNANVNALEKVMGTPERKTPNPGPGGIVA